MSSAAAAVLSRVLETPGILSTCSEYQDGVNLAEYPNGDVAAAQGHLSLLKIRRQLCRICRSGGDINAGVRIDEGTILSEGISREEEERERYAEDLRYTHCAADWAATQGHLEVVKWLLENRDEGCTESAVDGACWNGHSQTVRWLLCDWGQEGSERALDYAASTGRLELVKWLNKRGARCTSAAMDGAAGGGHLDVVHWLEQHRQEGCSHAAFEMAAAGGHLHVIKWLDEAGLLRCSSTGLDSAAGGGHLNVLQWMLEQRPEHKCTSNAYGLAANGGRLEVLEWLKSAMPDLRCPAWSAESAAAAGHLTVVKWLHDTGLSRASLAILDDVAAQGRLEAVVWLNERGAGATEAAVDRAAEAGYADVVAYLLEHRYEGCSPVAIVGAARNGHLAAVKALLQRGREHFGCRYLEAREVAEAQGHCEVARWLQGHVSENVRGRAIDENITGGARALTDAPSTHSSRRDVSSSGPNRENGCGLEELGEGVPGTEIEAVRPLGIREGVPGREEDDSGITEEGVSAKRKGSICQGYRGDSPSDLETAAIRGRNKAENAPRRTELFVVEFEAQEKKVGTRENQPGAIGEPRAASPSILSERRGSDVGAEHDAEAGVAVEDDGDVKVEEEVIFRREYADGIRATRRIDAAPASGGFLIEEASHHSGNDEVGNSGERVSTISKISTKLGSSEVKGGDDQGASLPGQAGVPWTRFVRRVVAALARGFVDNPPSPD